MSLNRRAPALHFRVGQIVVGKRGQALFISTKIVRAPSSEAALEVAKRMGLEFPVVDIFPLKEVYGHS